MRQVVPEARGIAITSFWNLSLSPDERRIAVSMAAEITVAKELRAGVPQALFPTTLLKTNDRHTYAVTNDGKRFLLTVRDPRQASPPITMVLNWPSMLKK